ncbi:MAG: polyprenyl synthetase family protein [Gemmatimonadetes bacterium]|nr:polyprenyl synthetase family protein [Gemmatimonadota bacterium]
MTSTVTNGGVGAFLGTERARVDRTLAELAASITAALDPELREPVRYALDGDGKRLRPILCVTTYRALRGDPVARAVYEAACAIELIHTYSLVHDDLPCMDDDDLRRGRATVHRVYGSGAASIAGAVMIPLAVAVLDRAADTLGLDAQVRKAVVRELTDAAGAGGMVGGQLLDLEAEGGSIDVSGLEKIHHRKTGALFVASLRIGARLAGAPDRLLAALGSCGEWLGLAFQVTDDVLDETSESSVLGKTAGRDRAQGKATFAALLGVAGARRRARAAADSALAVLRSAGVQDGRLEALADYAVERDR